MDRSLLVLTVAVIGAVVAFIWSHVFPATSMSNVNVGTVGTVLTSLMFVALLIERAVEVYISPTTGAEKETLKAERDKLADTIKLQQLALEAARSPGPGIISDAAAVRVASDELALSVARDKKVSADIAAADRRTQKIALSISIPLSFLAALAGLRTIGAFLPEASIGTQKQLFVSLDVLLTAGLLAGGADGIHKVLDRFIKVASGQEKPAGS